MEILANFDWMTWIFSGIGTEIVAGLFATLFGGFVINKVIIKQRVNQKQTAGKNSKQIQSMKLSNSNDDNKRKSNMTLNQSQKSGDNSEQIQIGGIHDDE